MVNRVLIRLKTVQLLYSYMLSRSEVKVAAAVETSSPDRRYSFTAYSELLLMMLELSGYKIAGKSQLPAAVTTAISSARFADTKVARYLAANDDVHGIMNQYGSNLGAFDAAIPEVIAKLKALPAYRTLNKVKVKDQTPADEIAFWTAAINAMANMPSLLEALHHSEEFTVRGLEMGVKMLIETLRSYSDTRSLLVNCKKDLQRSMDQAYQLYHWLLWLPVEIARADQERLDANAKKYLPSQEDLHPDRRFADGKIIDIISSNEEMQAYLANNGINWHQLDISLVPHLLDLVLASPVYQEYMDDPGEKSVEKEVALWRKLLNDVILPSDALAEALESYSIFWNDDLSIMSSFAIKTLKALAENPQAHLLPEYKDDEDASFGAQLFDSAVTHREEYRKLIDEFINAKRWDADRVALMDVVILETALAEAIEFPNIPLSVTANEYVEIANWYSTSRSGSFVNGVFASITDKLRKEGRIIKNFN